MKNYKTTNKDFQYFKSRCKYWIEYFGLKQWDVYYLHEEDKNNFASCASHYRGKSVTIFLEIGWSIEPTKKALNLSAFHEVCEILLAPLFHIAEDRTYDEAEHVSRHHEVIRTLENVILKD